MKSVLISIQPKWCGLIARGKKTVEVRKTKPKLETPFKVYIYCTYGQGLIESNDLCYPNMLLNQKVSKNAIWGNCCNGKVIGEFVCDEIYDCRDVNMDDTCITVEEWLNYTKGHKGIVYGWHISNLVIYDNPKELGEFYKPCIDEEYQYCPCCKYGHEIFSPDEVECSSDVPGAQYEQICLNRIKRPPQSWCYVESEVQGE